MMTKLSGQQLSLIAESEILDRPVGDWDYDELGTNEFLVPNSTNQKLGTNESLVPNSTNQKLGTKESLVPNSVNQKLGTKNLAVSVIDYGELGTNKSLVPNFEEWKPPIGCFQHKWIKDRQYWYWRYYKSNGKKASLYLARDYNKAIARAIRIGIPPNAKQTQSTVLQTKPLSIDIISKTFNFI